MQGKFDDCGVCVACYCPLQCNDNKERITQSAIGVITLVSNFWKSLKIQTTIIVFSLILANIFGHIFYSRGVYTVAGMASWIPGLAMGLSILCWMK